MFLMLADPVLLAQLFEPEKPRTNLAALCCFVVIGATKEHYENLKLYVEVMLPGWALLSACSLNENLLDFLLVARPAFVLINVETHNSHETVLLNELASAVKVIATYAVNAPELQSSKVRFLQTPYSLSTLYDVMSDHDSQSLAERISSPSFSHSSKPGDARLRIPAWERKTIVSVKVTDVVYVSRRTAGIILHLKDGRELPAANCDHLRTLLQTPQFVEVRHSRFVNRSHVQRVIPLDNGGIALKLRYPFKDLLVTRNKRQAVKNHFGLA
jgi:DNA-binding LytR/AlgR family response regulator